MVQVVEKNHKEHGALGPRSVAQSLTAKRAQVIQEIGGGNLKTGHVKKAEGRVLRDWRLSHSLS